MPAAHVRSQLRGKIQHAIETSKHGDVHLYEQVQKLRHDLIATLETVLQLEGDSGDGVDSGDEATSAKVNYAA